MHLIRMFISPAVLLLLLCSTALPARASLSAFSETRSFRDALEGRSMEDAISGPVDKDTSSYGDRAAASASPSAGSSSSSMQSNSMMLNIPANGNMMGYANQQQQTSQTDEQTKSMNGQGELEREAGPIGANQTPVEGEQQMMEQRAGRQQARSGRGRSAMRSGRQQQQPEQEQQEKYPSSGAKSPSAGESGGFGDEQQQTGSKQAKEMQQSSYGQKQSQQPQQQMGVDAEEQQMSTTAPDMQQQQQQQMMTDQADQEQKSSYGGQEQQMQMLAKQRAMAAMLSTMSNGMKYSRAAAGPSSMQMVPMMQSSQYGDAEKKMAQSPMSSMAISMANKAAYMGQQQQQYQRQTAPPMMGQMNAKMSQMKSTNGYGSSRMSNANYNGNGNNNYNSMASSAPLMAAMQSMMNGNGMRGNLRRANQRKLEKKMSPAMVNAMLNKMISAKQQAGEMESSGYSGAPAADNGYSAGAYGAGNKPMKGMSMMAKADMMANLMMPQMSSAMAGMPAGKREQYKRMLMATMMQQMQQMQQSEMSSPGDYAQDQQMMQQPQQTQMPIAYGERSNKGSMSPASMVNMMSAYDAPQQPMKDAGKYNKKSMETAKTPMPGGQEYDGQQQQQQQQVEAPTASGMEQQKQMGSMDGNYGLPMMEQQREISQSNYMDMGKSMKMHMQRQMQMPNTMSMGSAGAYGSNSMAPMMNGAGKTAAMAPMSPAKSYGGMADEGNQQQQQQQQQMMMMMMGDGYSDMGMQQKEVMSTMMPPMAAKTAQTEQSYEGEGQSSGSKGAASPKSPMNGFRQVYSQTPMQAQMPMQTQMPMQAKGSPSYSSTTPASTGDASSGSQKGYGGADMQQQMNQEGEGQEKQEEDYGQAPIGQAEPFAFDYKIDDDYGNTQYRREKSDENGVVRGSYGYTDTSGIYRHVEYVADENGFRAKIKSNEPGLSSEPAKTAGQSPNGQSMSTMSPMSAMDGASQAQMPVMQQQTMMSAPVMPQQPQQQQQMFPAQQQTNSEGGEKKSK